MEPKTYNRLVKITTNKKKSRLSDIENKLGITSGKGNIGLGGWWEVQTIGCKIIHKDVLYNVENTANIL